MSDLISGFGLDFLQKINQHKALWAADQSLLSDGSLGPAGPFDKANETLADVCRTSKGWKDLDFLNFLVLLRRPSIVLELGTNIGISAAYLAAGLKATGNNGWVHTIDASPYRIKAARTLHESLGLDNVDYTTGLFYDVLPDVLNGLKGVDMAFIDGQHALKPTLYFFEEIAKVAGLGTLLVFADIHWSDEKKEAWRKIRNDHRVYAASENGGLGFVLLASAE